jgi:hypothetical protein
LEIIELKGKLFPQIAAGFKKKFDADAIASATGLGLDSLLMSFVL